MKLLSLAAAALLFSTSTFAATIVQQNLIPEAQKSEFIVWGQLQSVAGRSSANADLTGGGLGLGLSYYYGFMENNAIGLSTKAFAGKNTSKSDTTETDTTTKGLQSLNLSYKGNFEIGAPTLFVELGYSVPDGDFKIKETDSNSYEMSYSRGQKGLYGQLGFVVPVDTLKLGASVGYFKRYDGKIEMEEEDGTKASSDTKAANSMLASVFTEIEGDIHLNLSANYQKDEEMTWGTSGTFRGLEMLSIAGGMRSSINESTEIIGSADLGVLLNASHNNMKSYAQVNLYLGIRLTF
ncbi:hypothetical protein [Bdellovibrio sp. HCB209]|uniref:hypothetical protein n=1 Tax=Bdellovibrio sp. HCB209 TaxID=3394354 RepID=UPI0039B6697A